jgi:hypothetical protein
MYSSVFIAALFLALPNLLSASPIKRDDGDFLNPALAGGSFLDKSAGLGEPLNVSRVVEQHESHGQ